MYGARHMLRENAIDLTTVSRTYGIHVNPDVPAGKVRIRLWATMGAYSDFKVIVRDYSTTIQFQLLINPVYRIYIQLTVCDV